MIQSFLNGLFGCSHARTTFPLTPGRKGASTRSGTYVVCLDCGREFNYDWSEMRIGQPVGVISPSTTGPLAPVADGRFDGLRRHVS